MITRKHVRKFNKENDRKILADKTDIKESENKIESKKVGRNEKCPCGSG